MLTDVRASCKTIHFLIIIANEGVSSKAVIHRAYWTQLAVQVGLIDSPLYRGVGQRRKPQLTFCVSVKPGDTQADLSAFLFFLFLILRMLEV